MKKISLNNSIYILSFCLVFILSVLAPAGSMMLEHAEHEDIVKVPLIVPKMLDPADLTAKDKNVISPVDTSKSTTQAEAKDISIPPPFRIIIKTDFLPDELVGQDVSFRTWGRNQNLFLNGRPDGWVDLVGDNSYKGTHWKIELPLRTTLGNIKSYVIRCLGENLTGKEYLNDLLVEPSINLVAANLSWFVSNTQPLWEFRYNAYNQSYNILWAVGTTSPNIALGFPEDHEDKGWGQYWHIIKN